MSKQYLFVLSEDPLELAVTGRAADLAQQLRARGHAVAFFLVQNAVLVARSRAAGAVLQPLLDSSAEIMVDDFSLRERGIEPDDLRAGITMAPIDALVHRLATGWITVWS